jgi:phosphoribosylanthranilate isomerase
VEEDVRTTQNTAASEPMKVLSLPPGPVVKICGLTRVQDARVAAQAGAWALGFVFAPSPRRVTAEEVARILEQAFGMRSRANEPGVETTGSGRRPLIVGVFGDQPPVEIADTQRIAGLDAVQLHGRYGPGPLEVRCVLPAEVVVIKAVAVAPDEEDPAALRTRVDKEGAGADIVLLDTAAGGRFGGTGEVFRWQLARGLVEGAAGGECGVVDAGVAGPRRFLVAGGIGPGNARDALIRSGAWGVDVSGGVEVGAGIKDSRAMRELIETVNGIRTPSQEERADERAEGSRR